MQVICVVPKVKTDLEKSLGRLVSAIQKEWLKEDIEGDEFSMGVLDSAHRLLQLKTPEAIHAFLGPLTVEQYLGELWVRRHPAVKKTLDAVQATLGRPEQLTG